jgi:deoxyribose-phosphate aldolase
MVDLSAVHAEDDEPRVRALAARAAEIRPWMVSTLPGYVPLLKELVADLPDVGVGGNVAFPAGGCLPQTKVAETRQLVAAGCDEIDMTMDIGRFRSGDYAYCLDDIRGVIDAAAGLPVKVILECHYLTDDQIRKGAELCVQAGAAFVKTGTGWTPTGATLDNIALIKRTVGDAIRIKAAGGVRGLETLVAMYRRGATRFGLGLGREEAILAQVRARDGQVVEFDAADDRA